MVPLLFISAKERVIERGKEYAFAIRPIDPYNFFQGRYVDLNISPLPFKNNDWTNYHSNDIVYLEFKNDSLGAKITGISHERSKYSLKIKLYSDQSQYLRIRLPFKKFFVEEFKARNIENELAGLNADNCFVHARILNGEFVLTDISSNGISLITKKTVSMPK